MGGNLLDQQAGAKMKNPSMDYADLEVNLRRGAGDGFTIAMTFSQPGMDTDIPVVPETRVRFDFATLRAAAFDPAGYGRLLSDCLFAERKAFAGFQKARSTAQVKEWPLRVRLRIDPGAPELHAIFWELLRDPEDPDLNLFTGEGLLFSRYLESRDFAPIMQKPKSALRALAAVANPSNLSEYGLEPIDRGAEFQRAMAGLGDIPVQLLPANGGECCTLDEIFKHLREGCEILYLVAHGQFSREQPWLVLEGADGKVAHASALDLVSRIRDLEAKPRLVVLASCESAGRGEGQVLQALGPRLAEAGVPAVLAMQGSVSMDTISRFMPAFFEELQQDGRIDRAVSVARGRVRERDDFWMPVLFMRLKSGRLWVEEESDPFRSAVARLHQVPPPPGDFTGREKEIAAIVADFERGKGAAISGLTGMGGIGKTAIGLVIAQRLEEKYPEAQIFLDLKGTSTPLSAADVMRHVITSLEPTADLRGLEGAALAATYQSVLHGKQAFLFYDNARSAEQIGPLQPPASCGMFVTSRWTFPVPGLNPHRVDVMEPAEAQAYLLEICERIGEHGGELAEACGWVPLALKIAGSFLQVNRNQDVAKYIARLKDRRRTLAEIHTSREQAGLGAEPDMLATFDLSYAQLAAEDQLRWRLLGVFPAPFPTGAAARVMEMEEEPALALLASLERYSLLEYDAGKERYHLHDLLAEYALEQMEPAERDSAHSRHAQYFAGVLAEANQLLLKGGENIMRGLGLYDADLPHIEAGQKWASEHLDVREAAEVCSTYAGQGAIDRLRLPARKRIEWLDNGVKAARILQSKEAEGAHLGNLGLAYADLGDAQKAIEFHEQALVIHRAIGDRREEGADLGNLGLAYADLGDARQAIDFHVQGLVIHREIGDRQGEGHALGNLGNAYANVGDARQAIHFHMQALGIHREIGDRRGEGADLGNLGNAYDNLGDGRKAIEFYEQQLVIAREIGDRRGEGNALFNMGLASYGLGENEAAVRHVRQARAIYEAIESPYAERARNKLKKWGAME